MLSRDAESCSVLEKLRWSGEEETQTAVIERWWRASHSSLRVKRSACVNRWYNRTQEVISVRFPC